MGVINMATGALATKMMQGSKDRQMAFFKSINPAIATLLSTCASEPDKKFFDVLVQAVKKEMGGQ